VALGISHERSISPPHAPGWTPSGRFPALRALLYADQPYAVRRPWAARARLREIRAAGVEICRAPILIRAARTPSCALRCYASQLRGLRISATRMSLVCHRYWNVPDGWEAAPAAAADTGGGVHEPALGTA
jgi:hypothetical protein